MTKLDQQYDIEGPNLVLFLQISYHASSCESSIIV